jgi:metacaspase-1
MAIRKALLVGINAYTSSPLRGCLNDVKTMRELLTRFFGFADTDIRSLLDSQATAAAIQAGLTWLAEGGDDADAVRVFHFSGHGYYVADTNGDEPDGRDEALVPFDYDSAGFLTDDVLKTHYDRFPKSGNLTLVMDCCHSGTIQKGLDDIVYRFLPVPLAEVEKADAAKAAFEKAQRAYVIQSLREMGNPDALSDDALAQRVDALMRGFEKKRYGDVRVREANVLISGCRSDQTSADAPIAGDFHGALTWNLGQVIRAAEGRLTYRQLITQASTAMAASQYSQIPQLEYAGTRDQKQIFAPFA